MSNIIYLDVLIVLNLFINYFILLTVSRFAGSEVTRKRILAGAGLGSLSSLIIFLPHINFIFLGIIKFIFAAFIVLASFGFNTKAVYIKTLLIFWAVSFAFGGIIFAVWIFITPSGMFYKNGAVYFNVSSIVLAFSTIVTYAALSAIRFAMNRRITADEKCKIIINADNKEIIVDALIDTGNLLTDTFTGLPVIVCSFNIVKNIIPSRLHPFFLTAAADDLNNHPWASRIRVVPYNSVGSSGEHGLLTAFKPDKVYIINLAENGVVKRTKKHALIGVTAQPISDGEYGAVIGKKLI